MSDNSSPQSIIVVSGIDAEKFLQGQLTCDMREVKTGKVSFGAYCNVKGRVVATFHIYYREENFYLILPQVMLKKTIALLRKYGAFSKVKIEQAPPDFHFENQSGNRPPPLRGFPIPSAWEEIQAGFPIIYPETSEMFTPQMLNLPELNAVSFTKGCYLGQEIVARTEYLGKAKRHLIKLKIKSAQAILPGQEINDENNNSGIVINALMQNDSWLVLAVI